MFKFNFKKYFLIIAAVVLLIFFHYLNFLSPAENFIIKFSKPALSKFYSLSSYLRSTFNTQAGKIDLAKELLKKEDQVNGLIAENARLKYLEEENGILRQYLKFSKEKNKTLILGNILSRGILSPDNLEKNITIDKGASTGVKKGAAVLDGQGIVIGKIIAIKNDSAEVCLITGNECKLAATLENNEKTSGIARGEHGLTIKMEFIPQTVEIKEGDFVTTSGLEKDIPRGLVIGRVTKIDKASNNLWQEAIIEPLVNFDNLTVAAVLAQ